MKNIKNNQGDTRTIIIIVFAILAVGFGLWVATKSEPVDPFANQPASEALTDSANTDQMMVEDSTNSEEKMMEEEVMMEKEEEESEMMPEIVVVKLNGFNFGYSQDEIRVKQGDKVRIEMTSTDGFHDWVVDEFEAATDKINTGDTTSVEFIATKKGTFEFYCSVGKHRENGMVGNLIVE